MMLQTSIFPHPVQAQVLPQVSKKKDSSEVLTYISRIIYNQQELDYGYINAQYQGLDLP
jgi:hypothetical protein